MTLPSPEEGLFAVFAVATVVASIGVIVAKNPIASHSGQLHLLGFCAPTGTVSAR